MDATDQRSSRSGGLADTTRRETSPRGGVPRSLATTPPPDDFRGHLITGVGCLFPSLLPSRASTLSVGGETASNASATPRRGSEDVGDNTQAPSTPAGFTTSAQIRLVPVNPLTPSPTPIRKRQRSPPSTPRATKRPRSQEHQGDADGDQSELGLQEFLARQAFLNARQRTAELAATHSTSSGALGDIEVVSLASNTTSGDGMDGKALQLSK